MFNRRKRRVGALIGELDSGDTDRAEGAEATLKELGDSVVPHLVDAIPAFGRYGQLCGIEVLEHIGDRRAGPMLIGLLYCEDETVRTWSARALGSLGVSEAVPELERALDASRRRGTAPDRSEPEAVRGALRRLGAHTEVVPARASELALDEPGFGRAWLPRDLPEAIESLAAAGQVVAYLNYWQRWEDTHTWVQTPAYELDWSLPWEQLVDRAREAALDAAARAIPPAETIVVLTWLDESDR